MYPHPHRPFSRGANNRFARMLVVVMPGSLLLTWLWKQHEMLTPRENDWPASEPDAVDIRRTAAPVVRAALRRVQRHAPPPTAPAGPVWCVRAVYSFGA